MMKPRRSKMVNHHDIKCHQPYFCSVWYGDKTAELRLNDRDYKVGDTVTLHETSPCYYTGRTIDCTITHVLQNYVGIEHGYCMLSFRVVKQCRHAYKRRLIKRPEAVPGAASV